MVIVRPFPQQLHLLTLSSTIHTCSEIRARVERLIIVLITSIFKHSSQNLPLSSKMSGREQSSTSVLWHFCYSGQIYIQASPFQCTDMRNGVTKSTQHTPSIPWNVDNCPEEQVGISSWQLSMLYGTDVV